MRLCLFGLNLAYKGGVENFSVNLVKHLAQSSAIDDIFVLCDSVDEEALGALKHKKIHIQCVGRFKGELIRIVIRNIGYTRLSKELDKFEIFHVLDYRALPVFSQNGRPLIVTIHNVTTDELLIQLKTGLVGSLFKKIDHYAPQAFLELLSVAKANGIVVNSPITASRLRKLYGTFVDRKTWIIPAGFDPEKFNPHSITKLDAKRFLGVDSSFKILLHIGVWERKGLPYLLNALNYLHKTGEMDRLNILLLVLGNVDARYREFFSRIKNHVRELPWVSEDVLPTVFRAADVFVMPSISEGWGIALIEALASGIPVVTSQYVPSALATENTGAVSVEREINNPVRLAKSILSVIRNDAFTAKDWNRIFDFLVRNYSWQNVSMSQLKVYEEFINRKN